MKIAELTLMENELYDKVIELYHHPQSQDTEKQLQDIFSAYRDIHKKYSELATDDIESLKRGLFIQWYALSEPNYLTGIGDLDEQAEIKIIQLLNERILNNNLDDELDWMLNYYLNWDWIFDRFKDYKGLEKIKGQQKEPIPNLMDNNLMRNRGQMGIYWNSINNKKKRPAANNGEHP